MAGFTLSTRPNHTTALASVILGFLSLTVSVAAYGDDALTALP